MQHIATADFAESDRLSRFDLHQGRDRAQVSF
jgi:hypothetical protein